MYKQNFRYLTMRFGQATDVSSILWTPKCPQKIELIAPLNNRLYTGAGKWGRQEWIGTLYPKGTKDKEFLDHYKNHFNAVELNATHYRVNEEDIVKWQKTVSGLPFLFCPSVPQNVSVYGLKSNEISPQTEKLMDRFIDACGLFRENRGCVLFKLSDKFNTDEKDKLFSSSIVIKDGGIPRLFSDIHHGLKMVV